MKIPADLPECKPTGIYYFMKKYYSTVTVIVSELTLLPLPSVTTQYTCIPFQDLLAVACVEA